MRGKNKRLWVCMAAMAFGYMVSAFGQEVDWDFLINRATQEINRNAKDPLAYANRGKLYYQKGDIDRAIADYTQAIRLDPNNAFFYFIRGGLYISKEDINQALPDYQKAVQLDPSNKQYKEFLETATRLANMSKTPPSGTGSWVLRNTTWHCADIFGGMGGGYAGILLESTLDFGSNTFKLKNLRYVGGILLENQTRTGTYDMSGDMITLYPDDGGDQLTGRIIGNSLTLEKAEYRRVQ